MFRQHVFNFFQVIRRPPLRRGRIWGDGPMLIRNGRDRSAFLHWLQPLAATFRLGRRPL